MKIKANGNTFNASVYLPRGKIHVQEHASSSNPAYMTGQFIANEVQSTAKYVIWNSYSCDGIAPALAINPSDTFVDIGEEDQEVIAFQPDLDFETSYKVYPVPNNGIFTASINSPINEIYHISIYSSIGELIFEKKNIEVRGLTEEVIDFQNVGTGVYYIVFWNDTHRVVKKVPINRK